MGPVRIFKPHGITGALAPEKVPDPKLDHIPRGADFARPPPAHGVRRHPEKPGRCLIVGDVDDVLVHDLDDPHHDRCAVEKAAEVGFALLQRFFRLLAFADVPRNVQVAGDRPFLVAKGRHRQRHRHAAAVLADIKPFALVRGAVLRVGNQHFETRADRMPRLPLLHFRTGPHFRRIMQHRQVGVADQLPAVVLEPAFRGRVDGPDCAVRFRGNNARVRAVEDRLLHRGGFLEHVRDVIPHMDRARQFLVK